MGLALVGTYKKAVQPLFKLPVTVHISRGRLFRQTKNYAPGEILIGAVKSRLYISTSA
jgi:hypothetical protein